MFQSLLPSAQQAQVHPSEGLCVLIANLIHESKPLYKVDAWVSEYFEGKHSASKEALKFNDDFLAGCLDKRYRADRASALAKLSAKAIEVHQLETKVFHHDTTSVTVYGDYDDQPEKSIPLTHGHNKDGKPEGKQLVFGLTVTADGYVPLQANFYDGNQSDDKTHINVWKTLRKNMGKNDFIDVADGKLCTLENMTTLASQGGVFISVMPSTRKEVKHFKNRLSDTSPLWQEAFQKQSSRKKDNVDIYQTYEGEKSSEGYGIIWVHSQSKQAIEMKQRKEKIQKAEDNLRKIAGKINTYYLKTEKKIEAAVTKAIKGVEGFFSIDLAEAYDVVWMKESKGRPTTSSKYIEKNMIRYELSWKIHQRAIDDASKKDGVFALITHSTLPAAEVLSTYKNQPYLEKRFSTLKSVLDIAPVYLKKTERVEAMMFLYFIALMMISLIERKIRLNMKKQNMKALGILAEKRKTATPTWAAIQYFFRQVEMVVFKVHGEIKKTILKGLHKLHENVLNLLETPKTVYHFHEGPWIPFI